MKRAEKEELIAEALLEEAYKSKSTKGQPFGKRMDTFRRRAERNMKHHERNRNWGTNAKVYNAASRSDDMRAVAWLQTNGKKALGKDYYTDDKRDNDLKLITKRGHLGNKRAKMTFAED